MAEAMQSQVGVPHSYSLAIVQNGYSSLKVTLKSASGNRACTFTPVVDGTGFTTYGKPGYYTCEDWYLDFRCGDGTLHSIFTIGEDISGHVSGNEISGAWGASWFDGWDDLTGVGMEAQFSGVRQTER